PNDHVEQQVAESAEDEAGHRRTIVPWTIRDVAGACVRSCSVGSSAPLRSSPPRVAGAAPLGHQEPGSLRSKTPLAIASWSSSTGVAPPIRPAQPGPLLLSERADLRVPLSERTRFRAVPADRRGGAREVRDLRGGARRACPLPGRRPLQGLRLLLDGLRSRLAPPGEQGRYRRRGAARPRPKRRGPEAPKEDTEPDA